MTSIRSLLVMTLILAGHAGAAEDMESQLRDAREALDRAARQFAELHQRLALQDLPRLHHRRPMLGVLLGPEAADGGVILAGVTPGGGAQQAGLKAGDRLVAIDDQRLVADGDAHRTITKLLRDSSEGDSVRLEYQRDGETRWADVVLTSMAGRLFSGNFDIDYTLGAPGSHATHVIRHFETDAEHDQAVLPEVIDGLVSELGSFTGAAGGLGNLVPMDEDLAAYFDATGGLLFVRGLSAPVAGGVAPVRAGDVLIAVDGHPISDHSDLSAALGVADSAGAASTSADVVDLTIQRHGRQMDVSVPRARLDWRVHQIDIDEQIDGPGGQAHIVIKMD